MFRSCTFYSIIKAVFTFDKDIFQQYNISINNQSIIKIIGYFQK